MISRPLSRLIVVLSLFIGAYAFVMAYLLPTADFSPIIMKLAQTPLISLTHFIGGGMALLLGLIQFNASWRLRYLRVHKTVGTVYFIAVFASGIAGLYMAWYAQGGWIAQSGFGTLSLLWLVTAAMALRSVLKQDIARHRFWIYLNYSLTLAAVTLRIEMPLGIALLGYETFYPIVAWICWMPNIYLAYRLVTPTPKDSQ